MNSDNRAMIRVREADGNDLDAVVEIGRRTWPATNGELYDPDFVPLFLDKWWTKDACIPSIRAGRTMVAQAGDEVVGMASYGPLEGRQIVWKLYVLPDWQGRGVGGQLLGAVLERIGHQPTFMSFAAGNDWPRGSPGRWVSSRTTASRRPTCRTWSGCAATRREAAPSALHRIEMCGDFWS